MVGTASVTSQGLGFGVISPPIRPFSGHGRLLIPHHLLAFAQCGRKLGFPGWTVPNIFLPPSPSFFFFLFPFSSSLSENSPPIIPKTSALRRGEAAAMPSPSLPRAAASSASLSPATLASSRFLPAPPGSSRLPALQRRYPRSRGLGYFGSCRADAEIPVASEICSA